MRGKLASGRRSLSPFTTPLSAPPIRRRFYHANRALLTVPLARIRSRSPRRRARSERRQRSSARSGATATNAITRALHQLTVKIKWADHIASHDYVAAEAYLSLKLGKGAVEEAVERLRKARLTTRCANDILRAEGMTPTPRHDPGVVKEGDRGRATESRARPRRHEEMRHRRRP